VRKVSIIPRGMALGVTLSTPDADRVSYSREELEAKIKVSLGGRTAEEVVYDKITTGAESDIQQLTQIARQMVGRWGMSEKLGPLTLLPSDGQGPFLPGPGGRARDRRGGRAGAHLSLPLDGDHARLASTEKEFLANSE
jgi:cell division protease FtsH